MDEFHTRSESEYADALSRFPYALTIVDGEEAAIEYERLKLLGEGSPVVIGGPSELALVHEFYERALDCEPSTQLILDRVAEMRFPQSLKEERARQLALIRRDFPQMRDVTDELPAKYIGEWPESVEPGGPGLTVAYEDISGPAWPRAHVALVPTSDWTEIPAYLRLGGWNATPEADHLVLALRSWRDRYGAELIGCSHDTMNIRVARPPGSRDEALRLAHEHQVLCGEVLNDRTLKELAAQLIEDDWWYFWWD